MRRLVFTASVVGNVAAVTPVGKVIQMLQDMVTKGEKQRHEEQVAFSTFSQYAFLL